MTLTCKLALERVRTACSNEVISENRAHTSCAMICSRVHFVSRLRGTHCGKSSLIPCSPQLFSIWIFFFFAGAACFRKHRVQLKITLEHAEVPPWLEKALFFWSWKSLALIFSQDFIF